MRRFCSALTGLALAMLPTMALAHHPTGGMTPASAWHGFLSGIGHPVLGPDHLAFLVGIGLLMGLSRRLMWLPLVFVATLIPGVLAHGAGLSLASNELLVAISIVVLGASVVLESRLPPVILAGVVLLAGFLHGYAFGETIVGAETTPIVAYLVGLSVMIVAMTAGIAFVVRRLLGLGLEASMLQRSVAALLLVGGVAFTLQSLVG